MLIRFKVKNFLSFGTDADGDPVEFAMTAGKVRQKQSHIFDDGNVKLLKLAAVYGANASGKSNLVRAMQFMKGTVSNGKLPDGAFAKYCKSDASNRDKESYFEVEIRLNDKYYAYGFEAILSRGEFVSEWLVELRPDGGEKTLFARDIREGTYDLSAWKKKDNELYKRLDIYAGDIQNDTSALFLSVMNQNKKNLYQSHVSVDIFAEIYNWIFLNWDIHFPNQPIADSISYVNDDYFNQIRRLMPIFGTGISDLKIKKISEMEAVQMLNAISPQKAELLLSRLNKIEEFLLQEEKLIFEGGKEKKLVLERELTMLMGKSALTAVLEHKPAFAMLRTPTAFILTSIGTQVQEYATMEFSHGESDIFFQLEEESDGTVRLLDLLEILIEGAGRTFIIDELDRCLHPSLTYKFIQTYLKVAQKQNIQLIVTTHESRLMDFDLLRRDEIWFAEKNKRGESQMYSLEEFNTRYDRKIDKAYLEGQYGGVPIFNALFPFDDEEATP